MDLTQYAERTVEKLWRECPQTPREEIESAVNWAHYRALKCPANSDQHRVRMFRRFAICAAKNVRRDSFRSEHKSGYQISGIHFIDLDEIEIQFLEPLGYETNPEGEPAKKLLAMLRGNELDAEVFSTAAENSRAYRTRIRAALTRRGWKRYEIEEALTQIREAIQWKRR